MALYEVRRTDEVGPGEWVSALVVAGGAAQAREMVKTFGGVTAKNVIAEPVDTTHRRKVLSAYWDERNPETGEWL